jgi:hypothetical protein
MFLGTLMMENDDSKGKTLELLLSIFAPKDDLSAVFLTTLMTKWE